MEKPVGIDVVRKETKHLKTGDVVGYRGYTIVSALIQLCQSIGQKAKYIKGDNWKFTHVSIIVNEEWSNGMCSLESTIQHRTGWDGVGLVPLTDRYMNYNGEIVLYRMNKELSIEQKNKIREFYLTHKNKKFERNYVQMIASAFDGNPKRENKKDLSTIFCSELTAQVYIDCGLLPLKKPSNEYSPSEFLSSPLNNGFKLVRGISFKAGINI